MEWCAAASDEPPQAGESGEADGMPSDARSEAARTGRGAECPCEDALPALDAETQDHGVEAPIERARPREQVTLSRIRLRAGKHTR